MSGPFRVGTTATFTDRAEELALVLDTMRSRGRLVLFGERRMGKTTLLRRAAEKLEEEGATAIYVDLWQRVDAADINREILRQLPAGWLVGERAQRLLHALRGIVQLGVSQDGRPRLSLSGEGARGNARATLERILTGIDEIAARSDAPVAIVFDEFQEIENKVENGAPLLRGIQQASPNVAYVLSGSVLRMIRELIGPEGPLLGIPSREIGPIPEDHLSRWIVHVLEEHDVEVEEAHGTAIVRAVHGTTSYALELANEVYRRGRDGALPAPGKVAALLPEMARAQAGRFETFWGGLHEIQKRLLMAVAGGEEHLHAAEAIEHYGLSSAGKVTYHRRQLRDAGVLMQADPPRMVDPFFRAWVAGLG